MTNPDERSRILLKAYQIWEEEGQPQGRHMEHWLQAQVLIQNESRSVKKSKKRVSSAKAAKPKKFAGSDDLTRIKGIGKVIEGKLKAMGVTNFAQIAGWNPSDIDKIDKKLAFKGRIDRDDWISQAKTFGKG